MRVFIQGQQNDPSTRKALIDSADEVVFVWDGRDIEAEMRYAMEKGKSVAVANPARAKSGRKGTNK